MNNDLIYLDDALQIISDVANRLSERTKDDFNADINLQDAVTLKKLYLGEALNRVSADFQALHASLPWSEAIGMRHRLAHDYGRVDINDVWSTATEDLPELGRIIREILHSYQRAA